MRQKIRDAFDSVKADEQMKEKVKQTFRVEAEREVRHHFYHRPFFFRMLAAVMILFLIFVGSINVYEVRAEAAYITMEGPVQICLSLNGKDKVIKAEGLNAEGETVVSQVDVSGMHYQEALAVIMDIDSYQECQGEKAKIKVSCHDDEKEETLQQSVNKTCHSYGQEYREHHGKNHDNIEHNEMLEKETDDRMDERSGHGGSNSTQNAYGDRDQRNQNRHHAGHHHE